MLTTVLLFLTVQARHILVLLPAVSSCIALVAYCLQNFYTHSWMHQVTKLSDNDA